MNERLLIVQLYSALGDVVAIAKPKLAFRGVLWDKRLQTAHSVMRRAKRVIQQHAGCGK